MTASKLRTRAKMLGLTPDDIPNKELKATVISTQIQMTAAGAFLSLMIAIKLEKQSEKASLSGTMPEFYSFATELNTYDDDNAFNFRDDWFYPSATAVTDSM